MISLAPVTSPAPVAGASAELQKISDRLEALQETLYREYDIAILYIGAGSALAILDHCLYGRELVMRDLDIFVCLGEEMTESKAFDMGRTLAGEVTGRFSELDVRPRRRGNPDLPIPAAWEYNSGYGLFLIDQDDAILDLTIFHSHADMLLNGIMNVDKVRIPLIIGQTLCEFVEPLWRGSADELPAAGVEDQFGGYQSWRRETADLVNEFDVGRAPLQTILRIIRTFAKFPNPRISESTRQRLSNLLAADQDESCAFYTIRGLVKLMRDRNAVWELNLLRQLGGLLKIGGEARQQLQRMFQVMDRFGHRSPQVEESLRTAIAALSTIEHQMKLQGAI